MLYSFCFFNFERLSEVKKKHSCESNENCFFSYCMFCWNSWQLKIRDLLFFFWWWWYLFVQFFRRYEKLEFENQIPPNRVPRAEQPYLWPELASKICYHCGANGHLAQQCPHEGKLCYNCKQFGHVTKDCPEQPLKSMKIVHQ